MTSTNQIPRNQRDGIRPDRAVAPNDREGRRGEYRPRVLLAEDDDDFRRLLQRWLEADGYRVTVVASGSALLEELREVFQPDHGDYAPIRRRRPSEEPPALIISDDRMPGIRGLRVLRQVREQGWTFPLVLITAFGSDEVVAEAESLGVKVVLKPFDIDELRTLAGGLAP